MRLLCILCFIFFVNSFSMAQESVLPAGTATLKGILFEKGTRRPLKDVSVFVLPQKARVVTDPSGQFEIQGLPQESEMQIVINFAGYKKLELNIETVPVRAVTLFLEKENYMGFETTIVGKKAVRDQAQKSLTQEQFLSLPGSGGDPVKAVQNLPGVNRVAGFSSQVVIQGSAPQDTTYAVDTHQVPLVFHFGGLSSVVMPEALESVDYLSAGYGPEYSRALGGIINLRTRDPQQGDRPSKGFFFVDTLKAGGLFEKKLSEDKALLVSGRVSYIGFILSKAFENNEDFNLTVAPEFADVTVVYTQKLNASDDFKLDFLASRDYLGFLLKEPIKDDPAFRGNFKNETIFYRFIPQWSRKVSESRKYFLSTGLGYNQLLVDVGQNYFDLKSYSLTVRGEWEEKWSETWSTQIGFDNSYSRAKINIRAPIVRSEGGVNNPFSTSNVEEANIAGSIRNIGLYLRNELKFSPWTLIPSLRLDRFSQTSQTLMSPRMAVQYAMNTDLNLKVAGGVYYQPPEPQETDNTFGNPQVKAPKAYHATTGFDWDLRQGNSNGWILSAGLFDKWYDQLVIQSSDFTTRDGYTVPEYYNNQGRGRSYGVESQLRYEGSPWNGWVSATLSRSVRWDSSRSAYVYQYDQTVNLNVVAAYDAGKNWKVATRARYVTGNPYTPIVSSSFDADNDVYMPKRGDLYSERFQPFMQVDLRVDKKFILNREIWSLYIDIQNLLNQKNPEMIQYSYNYEKKEFISGLPILPSIGVKGEF